MLSLRHFQTACFSFKREKDQGMRTAECWVNSVASNQEKITGAGFLLSSSQTTVIIHTAATSQVNVNIDGFGYRIFFDTHSGLCGNLTLSSNYLTNYQQKKHNFQVESVLSDFCSQYHCKLSQNILQIPILELCFDATSVIYGIFYSLFAF